MYILIANTSIQCNQHNVIPFFYSIDVKPKILQPNKCSMIIQISITSNYKYVTYLLKMHHIHVNIDIAQGRPHISSIVLNPCCKVFLHVHCTCIEQ